MDLTEAYESWVSFEKNMKSRGIFPVFISAINRQGTHDVVCAAYDLLQKLKTTKQGAEEWGRTQDLNHVAEMIQKRRSASMNDFEISHDSGSNTWHVLAGIQRFVQMTNWQYSESMRRSQHILKACGVNKALIKEGVREGDNVIVGEN